jgi:hypothetical protein
LQLWIFGKINTSRHLSLSVLDFDLTSSEGKNVMEPKQATLFLKGSGFIVRQAERNFRLPELFRYTYVSSTDVALNPSSSSIAFFHVTTESLF